MEAIESTTVERDGLSYRISIFPDQDAANPLDEWSEMGAILSLNRRHRNFDPEGVESAIASNHDAVPLSYYEHGMCLWSVAGELPAACRCPFDSVALAGIWIPDAETLVSASPYGGWTRRQFMRRRARQACDTYTQWCNGEIYGYIVERLAACPCCGEQQVMHLDSCWGFYGLEECRREAEAAIQPQPSAPAIETCRNSY
jgi:hypothetical protein